MHSKKGLRECPVLGTSISSKECGSSRGSQHACPGDCLYYPFSPANDEVLQAVEAGVLRKLYARAAAVFRGEDLERWRRAASGAGEPEGPIRMRGIWSHCELMRLYYLKRDADGHSFCGRWLLDPWANLSNDQRILVKAIDQSHPVLLEVHRILDEKTFEGLDLLTGRLLRVVDSAVAPRVSRYMTLLAWSFRIPLYDRLTGPMEPFPDFGSKSPLEVVQELAQHLGGPTEPGELPDWLAWNFQTVCEALVATKAARWKQALAAGDYRLIKTDYSFPDRLGVENLLRDHPGLASAPPQGSDTVAGFDRVWVVSEGPEESGGREPMLLGRVLTGEKRLRIEAMGARNHGAVRARIEGMDGLQFQSELAEDNAPRIAQSLDAYDPALVPESLLEDCESMVLSAQLVRVGGNQPAASDGKPFRKRYQRFPDEPLAALGGLTPKKAAGIPEKRPLLIVLMKRHIRDVDVLRRGEGLDFDLNPLLKELGLFELVSTPVPLGGAGVGEAQSVGMESGGKAAELSNVEIGARLNRLRSRYPNHRSAVDSLRERFPGFFEGLNRRLDGMLQPVSIRLLEGSLVPLFFIMVPEGKPSRVPSLSAVLNRVAEEVPRLFKFFDDAGGMPEGAPLWIADFVESGVLTAVSGLLLKTVASLDEEERPSEEDLTLMLAVLGSTLAELHGGSQE